MMRLGCLMVFLVGGCGAADQQAARGEPGADGAAASDLPSASEASARCRSLIERSGVAAISRCPSGTGDQGALVLPGQPGCLRDSYLATALAYCWRSECLAQHGLADQPRARDEAGWALEMLENAAQLCHQPDGACTITPLLPCP